ncbi:uncharacterized protein LOC121929267 [Sceloporus undulatus]|uniref:uncharacterized protein LOC121929267 n=1 Tax=Sceloporus undulatus TaxID=8520 RepID=UPI001C4D95BC|nr:uncharacterized protein LOC121929267 [Sceloporus undulatus]
MASGTRKATALNQVSATNHRRPSFENSVKLPESYEALLEEMRRLQAETNAEIFRSSEGVKREFKVELNEVSSGLDKINEDINKINGKMKSLELHTGKMEKKIDEVKNDLLEDQEQILRLQLKQRENCLKLRGLPEKINENLYTELSPILAKFIDESEIQFPWELDRIYRLNSHIAKLKKLPRDVVVYFVRKQTRNLVLQQSYKTKLLIDGNEIMILKDIPGKILKRRKDYNFLIDKLKKYEIFFKWEEIEGVQVTWKQKKIRLNSIEKARNFLKDIQKEFERDGDGDGGGEEGRGGSD